MDKRQLVLKRILEELNIPPKVDSIDDRVTLQKAIYLVQSAGLPLGYRFSWYLKGPYSTALTQDYFALNDLVNEDFDFSQERKLHEHARLRVNIVDELLKQPRGIDLQRHEWLELLASIHFLVSEEKLTTGRARAKIAKEKPHVAPFFDQGLSHLKEKHALPA